MLSEPVMKLPDQRPLLFSHHGSVADRSAECNYWPGAGAQTPFMYALMNLLSVEKPVRINSRLTISTFVHLHALCPNTVSLILSIGNSMCPSQSARNMCVFYLCLCLSHGFKIEWSFDECYIFHGECSIFCGSIFVAKIAFLTAGHLFLITWPRS